MLLGIGMEAYENINNFTNLKKLGDNCLIKYNMLNLKKILKSLIWILALSILRPWCFAFSFRVDGEVIKKADPHIGCYIEERKSL